MNPLTREEFVEALKVPHIMGRGEAYGVVMGYRRYWAFRDSLAESDPSFEEILRRGHDRPFGMRVLITAKHPDTFFAVTESEFATMQAFIADVAHHDQSGGEAAP